ncbi:MAG: hypothetical protein ABEJ94_02180 [Halorientalis sp.]
MSRAVCRLLLVVAVLSTGVVASTATAADGPDGRTPGNGTVTATAETTPAATVIASDGTFSGFTLGAAVLAVVLAGSYRYLRG